MDSKIFKTWLELQQHVPRKNIFGIIALIFLSGVLEIVGLGAILPILGILVDTSKLSEYHHFFVLKSIPQEYLLLSLLIFIIIFYIVKNIFLGFSTYKIFQSVFRLQDYFSKTLYRKVKKMYTWKKPFAVPVKYTWVHSFIKLGWNRGRSWFGKTL